MSKQKPSELIETVTGNKWNSLGLYELLADLSQTDSLAPSEIAEQHDISQKTARSALFTLSDFDIVVFQNLEAQLSGFGRVILKWREELPDGLDSETLSALGADKADAAVLSVLRLSALDNSTIEESCDVATRTRRRVIRTYTDKGWIEKSGGKYELTENGREGIAAYDEFITDIQNIYPKSPFFVRYAGPLGDLPTDSIREATMEGYKDEDPHAVLEAFRKVVGKVQEQSEINEIRSVSPIFSIPIIEFIEPMIADGAVTTCVLGAKAYRTVRKPGNIVQLRKFRGVSHVDVTHHDDVLYYGLGIINDDGALIASYEGEDTDEVSLHSQDDDFVEWVTNVYEETESHSQTVIELLKHKATPSFLQ